MGDTLTAGTPRRILVDSHDGNGPRDPFADEAIVVAGANITVAPVDADGKTFVSVADGVADGATDSITVNPGAEDVNALPGSDDITISVPAVPVPLAVSLE